LNADTSAQNFLRSKIIRPEGGIWGWCRINLFTTSVVILLQTDTYTLTDRKLISFHCAVGHVLRLYGPAAPSAHPARLAGLDVCMPCWWS